MLFATCAIAVWHQPYWVLEGASASLPEWVAEPDSFVSPCGKLRVVGDGGKVHVLTASTQERISTLGDLSLDEGEDFALAWSANRKRVAIALHADSGTVLGGEETEDGKWRGTESLSQSRSGIWDAETGQRVALFKLTLSMIRGGAMSYSQYSTRDYNGVQWSPDGTKVLTWSEGTIRIWDAGTGTLLHVLRGHTSPVCTASFSPDGKTIVSAGQLHGTRLWDAASGECLWEREHVEGVGFLALPEYHAATFSRCGRRIFLHGRFPAIVVVDAADASELAWLDCADIASERLAFSPDGNDIACCGQRGSQVWHRRRPEWWWGVFWLYEFWATVFFGGALVWSVWRDRKTFRAATTPPTESVQI